MSKWRRRKTSEESRNGSETLSDLALSALGVLMIAFTGYVLKFRSEVVTQVAQPDRGPEVEYWKGQYEQSEQVKAYLQGQAYEGASAKQALGNPQLFGLNGPLTGVVFCLDLSGSMLGKDGQRNSQPRAEIERRFRQVKERLKLMVRSLQFENFAVVGFGGDPRDADVPRILASSNALVPANDQAREQACRHIDSWQASGGTPTLPTLRAVFNTPGVEHVVLLTDGMPTVGGSQEDVLRFLKSSGKRVVVDVVGIGDQSAQPDSETTMALLDFTRQVAQITGGFFQAW